MGPPNAAVPPENPRAGFPSPRPRHSVRNGPLSVCFVPWTAPMYAAHRSYRSLFMPPIPHPKPSLVLVALLSGALALCAAGSVAAQTSDNDLATQHFEQGVELYQEG